MTNAMIIFNERCNLMDKGLIGTTGKVIEIEGDDGRIQMSEPVEIHTYQRWKELGYCVKKGEHAVAKFPIWKYIKSKDKQNEGKDEEEENSKMFLKTSAFFSISQVQPIEKK